MTAVPVSKMAVFVEWRDGYADAYTGQPIRENATAAYLRGYNAYNRTKV